MHSNIGILGPIHTCWQQAVPALSVFTLPQHIKLQLANVDFRAIQNGEQILPQCISRSSGMVVWATWATEATWATGAGREVNDALSNG